MALDRAFCTPTITVDQDKYDELIKIQTLYRERIDKKMKIMISQPLPFRFCLWAGKMERMLQI